MEKKTEKGSATIEAIVSLSIFIFAFVAIYSIVNMCLVQAAVQQALNKSAKEISQYYYFITKFQLEEVASGKTLDEKSQKALGVLSTFEDTLSKGEDAAQKVGNTVDNITKVEEIENNINASIESMKNLKVSVENLSEVFADVETNPLDYAKSFAALAASQDVEDAKSDVAAQLAKVMSRRHFTSVESGKYGEIYALDLESLGVKNGFEGMDFSQSKILQEESPRDIELVVVYELQVADILPFDFSITISQSAKTRGWAGAE